MIDKFNSELLKLLNHPINKLSNNFVLGLSGGVDSMVLLYLVKKVLDQNNLSNINIYPTIIDHSLRSESGLEAKNVKKISQDLGFKTIIKKIKRKKPNGNIQEWARQNRRELLFESCCDLSANLFLAHHLDDQAETIFMRSSRNSGIDGLSGMKTMTFWNGIFILRPLLKFSKNEIVEYANNENIKFYEDPSNYSLKYERVRIRKELKQIKNDKWETISNDLFKFSLNCNKLLNNINIVFENWLKQNILVDQCGVVRVNYESLKLLFKQSDILCVSLFAKILLTVGGKSYPSKRKKVYEVIKSLLICDLKKRTLGNVCINIKNDFIYFLREKRHLNYNFEINKNKKYFFDGRYIIISNVKGKLVSSENVNFDVVPVNSPFYEFKKIINKTIPCLQTLEGKLIKPHLNIIDTKLKHHGNLKHDAFKLYLINRVLI